MMMTTRTMKTMMTTLMTRQWLSFKTLFWFLNKTELAQIYCEIKCNDTGIPASAATSNFSQMAAANQRTLLPWWKQITIDVSRRWKANGNNRDEDGAIVNGGDFWFDLFGTYHVHRITHESLIMTYFQCGPLMTCGGLEWEVESTTVTHSSAEWWDLLLPLA